jgi:RimJ/RimL family protein N-acetyltransferase
VVHRYHFDDSYREETELRDGTPVLLRVVRPEDRERLREGFGRLSSESRYLRFMGRKTALSEAELTALTTLDGEDRFAIGAARPGPDGEPGEGLGVARFVRVPGEPDVAEAAITVVDEVQRRGLGSLLLRRLAAAARERGVRRFRGEILLRNDPMRRLLEEHLGASVTELDKDVLRVQMELPSYGRLMAADGDTGLLGKILEQAASGGIVMRLGDVLLKRGGR